MYKCVIIYLMKIKNIYLKGKESMLKIYNTKTKEIETFNPLNPQVVNMYVCGPTVYDHIHIGNARPVIFFDLLKSYLTYLGYDVKYVSNITDVDDKIIDKAIKQTKTEKEVSAFYTKQFEEVSLKITSKLPDLMPKATSYIEQMVTYIQDLIDKGYAYVSEDAVYFEVSKLTSYGQISGQKLDDLHESVRITNNLNKRNPKDFTLWKKTDKGITFKSPWFDGRPGWHTECAVMNHAVFNGTLDIHGGGTDLIFPHHENEEAQTLAHDGHSLSQYWMHVARLDMNQEKMSKSLGNVILVKDLLNKVDAKVFRLLMVGHHYRQPISYHEDLLMQYVKMYDKIKSTILKSHLKIKLEHMILDDLLDVKAMEAFEFHMNQDLNTPNVVSLILEIVKKINGAKTQADLKIHFQTLKKILSILDLYPDDHVPLEVIEMHRSWMNARENKQYEVADHLRSKLSQDGWI